MEDFDPDHIILPVEIQDYSRMHLFGLNNLGFIQSQIDGIGFFVELDSHNAPPILRSKNAVITDHGFIIDYAQDPVTVLWNTPKPALSHKT
jgi:hypothetical protein